VIRACERVTGREVPTEPAPRRPGDPPALVADPQKLKSVLGWEPRFTSIDDTVATAWRWHEAHPTGYGER